jgi:lysophospholipase L1-like esterase
MCRASLVAMLVFACGWVSLADRATAQEARGPARDPQRFAAEIRAFEAWDRKNSAPQDAVLFVGSSSIRLWPTAESFPGVVLLNRGFGGAHLSDVLNYADRIVFKYRPRMIVFYGGDNDLAEAGKSPAQVADEFQTFNRLVHERLPKTPILFLAIKPSVARWRLWPQMQEANALIRKQAEDDQWLQMVDTAPPLLGEDGKPRADLFQADGLHLNEAGYRAWTKIVAPLIAPAAESK